MAARTIGRIRLGDMRPGVADSDLFLLVVVAGITAILRVGVEVASLAALLTLSTVIKREGMPAQQRWDPGACGMAVLAF